MYGVSIQHHLECPRRFISGAPDERWDNDVLRELHQVHGSDFEAVDVSSLMVDTDSGQAMGYDLSDVVSILQVAAGMAAPVTVEDINGDNRIGLEETVYYLQHISGKR